METTFDLFVYEGQVWQSEAGEREEQPYQGPWPLTAWFTALDVRNGRGWGRAKFEKHGLVLTDYLYDVGRDDTTQALLAQVKTEDDLLALVKAGFELWEGKEPPPRL